MEKGKTIFSGSAGKVRKFRRSTSYWLIALLALTIPLFCYDLSFDKLSLNYPHFFDYILFPLFAIGIGVLIFSIFAFIPQNFEIREDGIAPPTRKIKDIFKRRERFIKFSEIFDIKIGENVIHHKIILKDGKTILVGLGGAFFFSLSVADNRVGKMEKILRKVREELVKYRDYEGEVIIKREDIGMQSRNQR